MFYIKVTVIVLHTPEKHPILFGHPGHFGHTTTYMTKMTT